MSVAWATRPANPFLTRSEQVANLALFTNVQSDTYWSGMEYAPGTYGVWSFETIFGTQDSIIKGNVL